MVSELTNGSLLGRMCAYYIDVFGAQHLGRRRINEILEFAVLLDVALGGQGRGTGTGLMMYMKNQ